MRIIFLYLLMILSLSISGSEVDISVKESPVEKIIIINSFDASSLPARKKKKELFEQLADSLIRILNRKAAYTFNTEIIIHPEVIPRNDSLITDVLSDQKASNAIVLESLDVFFHQTKVEVEKDMNGNKSRTAFFDICSYTLFKVVSNADRKHFDTKNCEFFTDRSVISGFFAGGPDIVGKSKHAFNTLEKHAERFLGELLEKGTIK